MEAKKNPSKDLRIQRNKFFLLGLIVSISLAITAFEWRTVKQKPIAPNFNSIESGTLLFSPITTIEPPKVPQPIKKLEPTVQSATPSEFVAFANDEPVDDQIPLVKTDSEALSSSIFISLDEEVDTVFVIVEKNPKPVYGFKKFCQQLGKNLKYPIQAKRMGIEGKVFVAFVVNRNGEASDLKILRGIGSGCDEEALRVLALTKWEPSKQRGKPVRVKMSMQINFLLGN
ncbi:MAG: TonB family protein [Cyclobacteriaceae bacterium]|nr:TonB family protein [Cyclobacteriaceae bacterium]